MNKTRILCLAIFLAFTGSTFGMGDIHLRWKRVSPTPTPTAAPTPTPSATTSPSATPSASPTTTPGAPKQKLAGIIELVNGSTLTIKLANLQSAPSLDKGWVDGYRLRAGWDEIQPNPSASPNWTPFDTAIATCKAHNKVISLSVSAGINTPAWVYDTPPLVARFNVDTGSGAMDMPFGFDPNLWPKWDIFVAQFGAKYDKNPTVRAIYTTGMGQQVAEFHVTANPTDEGEYATAATAAGYVAGGTLTVESVALRATITHVVGVFNAAFPTTPVLFTGGNPWGGGQPGTNDEKFAKDAMTGFSSNLRGTCTSFLHAKLIHSNTTPSPVPYPIGDQAISNSSDDSRFYAPPITPQPADPTPIYDLTQNGFETKDQYIEIYPDDVHNPINDSTMATQRLKLYKNAQVTPSPVQSPTPTPSASAPPPTATFTPTVTPTSTPTSTPTPTPTPTVTGTPSPTPTGTPGNSFVLPYHPVGDPNCNLNGYLYRPNPARWGPGPYPGVVITHAGGFKNGGEGACETILIDLAASGYVGLFVDVRLAKDSGGGGGLPGQTTTGHFFQQSDDMELGVQYLRGRSECNGWVATFGGSGSGGDAVTALLKGSADAAVSLSGMLDGGVRPASTGFISDVTSYYDTAVTATQTARSPSAFVTGSTKPIYFANGLNENMPWACSTSFKAALDAHGVTNYTRVQNADNQHSFATWSENKAGVLTFLNNWSSTH